MQAHRYSQRHNSLLRRSLSTAIRWDFGSDLDMETHLDLLSAGVIPIKNPVYDSCISMWINSGEGQAKMHTEVVHQDHTEPENITAKMSKHRNFSVVYFGWHLESGLQQTYLLRSLVIIVGIICRFIPTQIEVLESSILAEVWNSACNGHIYYDHWWS